MKQIIEKLEQIGQQVHLSKITYWNGRKSVEHFGDEGAIELRRINELRVLINTMDINREIVCFVWGPGKEHEIPKEDNKPPEKEVPYEDDKETQIKSMA